MRKMCVTKRRIARKMQNTSALLALADAECARLPVDFLERVRASTTRQKRITKRKREEMLARASVLRTRLRLTGGDARGPVLECCRLWLPTRKWPTKRGESATTEATSTWAMQRMMMRRRRRMCAKRNRSCSSRRRMTRKMMRRSWRCAASRGRHNDNRKAESALKRTGLLLRKRRLCVVAAVARSAEDVRREHAAVEGARRCLAAFATKERCAGCTRA
jgi:hypothetical protein